MFITLVALGACEGDSERRYVFSPSGLSLREAPSTEAAVLDVLPYGAPVRVIGAVDSAASVVVDSISGQWLEVRSGLRDGYVFSGYLTRFAPPTEPDVFPDSAPVRRRFVYGANVLSIRDRPHAVSGPLAFVRYRDSLDVLLGGWRERTEELEGIEGGWVRVRWRSVEGYVFDGYLSEFRPLERRISTAGEQFTLKYVQGIDSLTLHSAPDPEAPETGQLAYGDSLRVIPAANSVMTKLEGLPGTWVYGRSPAMEGFLFDGFLSEAPPPPRDSLPAGEPPPRPQRRWILATPGARVWNRSESRIFTQGFIHYADSVLLLFGGAPQPPAAQAGRAREALVHVKRHDFEGLVAASALSPLPVPVPDADFDGYLSQTIGETDSVDTLPGSAPRADTGTVTTEYEWGVSRTRRVLGTGSAETAYRLPNVAMGQAHRILQLTGFNEYFELAEFPTSDVTVGSYEVTVQLAPGGEIVGTYALDTRDGSVTALEGDSAGVTVTIRTAAAGVTADSIGARPGAPDSAGVSSTDPPAADPQLGGALPIADMTRSTGTRARLMQPSPPPPPEPDIDE